MTQKRSLAKLQQEEEVSTMQSSTATTPERPPKDLVAIARDLSEPMRDLLRCARMARACGIWGRIDLSGEGGGSNATARALVRRGLLSCAHPGGPSWGEFVITPMGCEVAELISEVPKS